MANISKWKQAADRLEAATTQLVNKQDEARRAFERGVGELESFLRTRGPTAQRLLQSSKRFIRLGEESEGGFASVYIFDAEGLRISIEPSGVWTVYADQKDLKIHYTPLSARDAVAIIVRLQRIAPEQVVGWLEQQLDAIADQILHS